MNSRGANSQNFAIRLALFQAFGDRYFPAPEPTPVELSTAAADAKMLVGNYSASRGSFTNFVDFANFLEQTHVGLDEDGRPVVPDALTGHPHKWIEVAPFLWQDALGPQRLSAKVVDGKSEYRDGARDYDPTIYRPARVRRADTGGSSPG